MALVCGHTFPANYQEADAGRGPTRRMMTLLQLPLLPLLPLLRREEKRLLLLLLSHDLHLENHADEFACLLFGFPNAYEFD